MKDILCGNKGREYSKTAQKVGDDRETMQNCDDWKWKETIKNDIGNRVGTNT